MRTSLLRQQKKVLLPPTPHIKHHIIRKILLEVKVVKKENFRKRLIQVFTHKID